MFSICEWGQSKPWTWAAGVGQLWRTTGDIGAFYEGKHRWNTGWHTLLSSNVGLENYAGPGHWNDPDMLEVGNGKMTTTEYRAHFSLWALLAAPLVAGNDIRDMSADTKEILMNKEVIAIDQDALGKQGSRISADETKEVWTKELSNGDWAVCVFNPSKTSATVELKWSDLPFVKKPYSVQDVGQKRI